MVKTVNERVVEETLKQALKISRVAAKERGKIAKLIKTLSKKLAARLIESDYSLNLPSGRRKKAIEKYLKECQNEIAGELSEYREEFQETLSGLAVFASADAAQTINAIVKVELMPTAGISKAQAKTLASEGWIGGKTVGEMFSRLEDKVADKVKEFARKSYAEGKTVQQMTRELTGYKDRNGVLHPGVIEATRKTAEGIVRTSVIGISNAARMETYRDNASVIKGVQWVATLDLRTCVDCAMRDGAAWDWDGNPISAHNFLYEEPPLHVNCRCVYAPVLRSFKEMDFDDFDEMSESTRASMDGQVPESLKFSEWFESLDADEQTEILGKGRYELYRDGKITFSDLIDQNGRAMTLKELYETLDL